MNGSNDMCLSVCKVSRVTYIYYEFLRELRNGPTTYSISHTKENEVVPHFVAGPHLLRCGLQ